MAEAVQSLKDKFTDRSIADMNVNRLDGSKQPWSKLAEICASAPFLADRRLVVVDHAGKLVSRKDDRARAQAIFENLPATTGLVLLDEIDLSRRDSMKKYRDRSALYQWAVNHQETSFAQDFIRPSGAAFVRWVAERAEAEGGSIASRAAQTLAQAVADDPYLAHQEIQKLLAYVDYARPIEAADVELLTPLYRQSDVFAMVDAVGARNAKLALHHLHQLLSGEDPRYAFVMIARQFRLLLQASQALSNGDDPSSALSIHPFVAGKVAKQARNFRLPQLESVVHQLYELDVNSKTGRADLATALDQLIIQLAR